MQIEADMLTGAFDAAEKGPALPGVLSEIVCSVNLLSNTVFWRGNARICFVILSDT